MEKMKLETTERAGSRTLMEPRRIVVKIGTSTIVHSRTGKTDFGKMEKLARDLSDLSNRGIQVVIVSSGAIGMGRDILKIEREARDNTTRQACSAVGQGRMIMMYEKFFSEYGKIVAQVLLTKESITSKLCRVNAEGTFEALLKRGVIPIVNENDSISTDELEYGNFGDNDTLSAYVAKLVKADLLVIMSDIDGLYTDDPRKNKNAEFIEEVTKIDDNLLSMGKGSGSFLGTGGMATKLSAAQIATKAGTSMVIVNGGDTHNIVRVVDGVNIGTIFRAKKHKEVVIHGTEKEAAEVAAAKAREE